MRPTWLSIIVPVAVTLAFAGCAGHKAAPESAEPTGVPRSAPKPPPKKPPAPARPVTGTGSADSREAAAAGPAASTDSAPNAPATKTPAGEAPPATASAYVFSPQQAVSSAPSPSPSPSPVGNAAPAPSKSGATDAAANPTDATAPSQPQGVLQLVVVASAAEINPGEVVNVDVIASSATAVLDAPLHLTFDPGVVEFVDGAPGDFLTQGGSSVVFLADGLSRPGDVAIAAGRVAREQGASGSGLLCRVRLRGIGAGAAPVLVGQAKAWGTGGEELIVRSAGTRVVVR